MSCNMKRSTDPLLVNRILNDPEVFPLIGMGLGVEEAFDFTLIIETNDDDYLVFDNGEDVVAVYERSAPGVYQQHTVSLKSASGMKVVRAFKASHDLLAELGVVLVWGQTPISNTRAQRFNLALGGHVIGTRNHTGLGPVVEFIKTLSTAK